MEKPRVTDLAAAVGISKTYASDILADKQAPSRPLAIRIFRETGWRHSLLDGLTDDQLAVLETVDPWTPKAAAA
jgi:plasmid maintenance system antidote protein VapI